MEKALPKEWQTRGQTPAMAEAVAGEMCAAPAQGSPLVHKISHLG